MIPRSVLAPLVLTCMLGACSAEQAYNAAQGAERSKCVNGPANTYQECLDRLNMSYEEYESNRTVSQQESE